MIMKKTLLAAGVTILTLTGIVTNTIHLSKRIAHLEDCLQQTYTELQEVRHNNANAIQMMEDDTTDTGALAVMVK